MATGRVKFFNADRGYGFIATDGGGSDGFVHITAVEAACMKTLVAGLHDCLTTSDRSNAGFSELTRAFLYFVAAQE
jgi:CspA family cold shock protein